MDPEAYPNSELPDETPTFDVTECVAGVVPSRVADVRTRLVSSPVSKT